MVPVLELGRDNHGSGCHILVPGTVAERARLTRLNLMVTPDPVRVLLSVGAGIEARAVDGSAPLHGAARWSHPEAVDDTRAPACAGADLLVD